MGKTKVRSEFALLLKRTTVRADLSVSGAVNEDSVDTMKCCALSVYHAANRLVGSDTWSYMHVQTPTSHDASVVPSTLSFIFNVISQFLLKQSFRRKCQAEIKLKT